MDLTILFNPIDESVFSGIKSVNSVYRNIKIFDESIPDYKTANLAIFGVGEQRGSNSNAGCASAPDEIRKKLYQLKKGTGVYNVIDLGNLKPGVDLEETYTRISEVCRMLLEQNTLPLILGGSHDLDLGQYRGYEDMQKLVSFLNVDAYLDLEEGSESSASRQHIHKVLLHEPNYLFSYTHLAHQSYLIDVNSMTILERLNFEAYRIGQLRTNLQEMEPAIRNADIMSFDITAIKSSDAPGNNNAQPFGLTGEEACQICWYAGMNEKLSSAGFYEYNPEADDSQMKTASVVATMIWYFIEGYYHRKDEQNFKTNDFLKFSVSMPVDPEVLIFFKSKVTERWWLEVPNPAGGRPALVPCNYSDYQTATKGDLPERYISTISKFL
jgi:formiminoglutamase